MSQTLGFADSGFVDAIRSVVIRVVVAHHNLTHEPLPIAEGVKLVQEKIIALQKEGDPLTGDKWAYPLQSSTKELTIRRRFNEAASAKFYAPAPPPLRSEQRKWLGHMESLYSPNRKRDE